jgi:3-phytase
MVLQERRLVVLAPVLLVAAFLFVGSGAAEGPAAVRPVRATEPVSQDADDPAIWIHPSDPARSLILGTDKAGAPGGGLFVFGLDGKIRQSIRAIDRPNNVDVEYGFTLGGRRADIAVLTERYRKRLRVFRISPETGMLADISGAGLGVFTGEPGERAEPMGISLYRRPRDGALFAVVSRKAGPSGSYLWQYRLEEDGAGRARAVKVREFGTLSGGGEVEAVAVDDALGYIYYAEENAGIHKWQADPNHPEARRELALFGREGFSGDREGIAVYTRADGTGHVLCTDQRSGDSHYRIYRREGEPGKPHDHTRLLKEVSGGADDTDGIEVTSSSLGTEFSGGLFVAMNSRGRNFLLYRWKDIQHSWTDASFFRVQEHSLP